MNERNKVPPPLVVSFIYIYIFLPSFVLYSLALSPSLPLAVLLPLVEQFQSLVSHDVLRRLDRLVEKARLRPFAKENSASR